MTVVYQGRRGDVMVSALREEGEWQDCPVEEVPYRFRVIRLAAKQFVQQVGVAQPDGTTRVILKPSKHHFPSRFVAGIRAQAYIQRFHATQANAGRKV